MALRFNHPRDIDAIMEWVRVKADPREAKQMTESLPGLPTGDFWAWARTATSLFADTQIPRRPSIPRLRRSQGSGTLGPFGTAEAMQGDGALRKVLSEPQYKMLQAVRETPGVSAESLATFMQTTMRARGFEANLRRLRADELVGGKDSLRVAEWLR